MDFDLVELEHRIIRRDPRGGVEVVLGLGPLLPLAIDRGAKHIGAGAVGIKLEGLAQRVKGAVRVVGIHFLNGVGDQFLGGLGGVVRLEDRAGAVGVACWARPGGERKRAEAKRTQEKERRWAGMVGKV